MTSSTAEPKSGNKHGLSLLAPAFAMQMDLALEQTSNANLYKSISPSLNAKHT